MQHFFSRNLIWKSCLQKRGHFVSASMCLHSLSEIRAWISNHNLCHPVRCNYSSLLQFWRWFAKQPFDCLLSLWPLRLQGSDRYAPSQWDVVTLYHCLSLAGCTPRLIPGFCCGIKHYWVIIFFALKIYYRTVNQKVADKSLVMVNVLLDTSVNIAFKYF